MKKNSILDVFLKTLSVFLCIIIVPTVVLGVIFSSLSSAIKPDTLSAFIEGIDVSAMLKDNADISEGLNELDIPAEAIDAILESDAAKELADAYAEEFSAALTGIETDGISADTIKDILNNNIDEIVGAVEQMTGEEADSARIKEQLDTFVDENISSVIDALPMPSEMTTAIPQEVSAGIRLLNENIISGTLFAAAAVLSVLVFLFRLKNWAGFLWLSVIEIVAGAVLLIIYVLTGLIKTAVSAMLPDEFASAGGDLASTAVALLTQNILTGFIVMFVGAAIFMAVYFILKHLRKRKALTAEAPAIIPSEPVQAAGPPEP